MPKKRIGIDALFQTSIPSAVPAATEMVETPEVPVERLAPNPRQPRAHFDEDALADLTASVRKHGVLQPLIVRRTGSDGAYEIVAGERRWRAARAAGLERVPVRILDLEEEARLAVAMVENLQREDLNPLEEAEGYVALLEQRLAGEPEFATFAADVEPADGVVRVLRALNNRAAGNTKDNVVLRLEPAVSEVFGGVGRLTWRSFVSHRLPLLSMPEDVKGAVRAGLPYTKARAIARLTGERVGDEAQAHAMRRELLVRATAESLSVRALQGEVARMLGEPPALAANVAEAPRAGLQGRLDALRARLDDVDARDYGPERRAEIAAAVEALLKRL